MNDNLKNIKDEDFMNFIKDSIQYTDNQHKEIEALKDLLTSKVLNQLNDYIDKKC